ncbi:glycoside hydrolase [Rhizoclosmatium globosum]|uniref:Glycoside hydrolase n=1 Tax=Rhizoclosmatium globosum TaxID=329046 RepID=A0A1Y2B4Z5_9FUNG|nr:glycoside hydrolase [Rhizoclosmatium globosum]|eukprot:ORY29901.1 glycoside hydrolase [Rhizoclosmatium globosum]
MLLNLILLGATASALAPLERTDGKILLGAWYDRNLSDTPSAVNARIGYKPLSFFQTDVDFSGTLKPWTSPQTVIPQFQQQLKDTNTDAIAMLTVYPFQGLGDKISDAQLKDMGDRLNGLVNSGRQVFLRFAPEMNGNWFSYGQDPAGFISTWQRCIKYWRTALGSNVNKVAFVWSPNSGNGYPYPGGESWPNPNSTAKFDLDRIGLMDTNRNGKLDPLDNPYIPFYPGDEYVDWVGISIYHYGIEWPWVNNSIPEPQKFERYITGYPDNGDYFGYFPFYTPFSTPAGATNNITNTKVSSGNKPFIVSETAATYHFAWVDSTTPQATLLQDHTRVEIKEAWWNSFLTQDFISRYPRFQAVCTFEFIKTEELTWRDFSAFGPPPNPSGVNFEAEDQDVANAFARDAKGMGFVAWAKLGATNGTATVTASATGALIDNNKQQSGSGKTEITHIVGALLLAAWIRIMIA